MHIPYTTITEAELKGLFHGLSLAILVNLSSVQVEIDAEEVITLLSSSNAKYASNIFYLIAGLHFDKSMKHWSFGYNNTF